MLLDLAIAEDLQTEFVWRTETPAWREGTRVAQLDPHMIIGTSDGGAHLDRDDGAECSSYFLRYWVREWGAWTLEEGVRQLTQWPAALCGFSDRGMVRPGFAADLMVFDPDTIGPAEKGIVHDFPNGEARYVSKPEGRARHHRQRRAHRPRRRPRGRRRPSRPGPPPRGLIRLIRGPAGPMEKDWGRATEWRPRWRSNRRPPASST